MKVYADDPLVRYKNSTINPERSKAEIDGILAEWQVKDVHWHWDPEHYDIYVEFKIEEIIDLLPVTAVARVKCPTIWNKAKPRGRPPKPEEINLQISMRAMWWFIYNSLNMSYAMQSDKITAFLPYIATNDRKVLRDLVLPRLQMIKQLEALPIAKSDDPRIIDVQNEQESS